jgi:hypothetical protein
LREAIFVSSSKNSNTLQNRFFIFQLKEKNLLMIAGKKLQTSRPIDDVLLLPGITTAAGVCSVAWHQHRS